MKKHRKTALILCLCILLTSLPVDVLAKTTTVAASDESGGSIAGYISGNKRTINDIISQYKFSGKTGHGFAAERGNNLIDVVKGKTATVIGDNNAKNGADRKIVGKKGKVTLIQDKYYASAKQGIEACFQDGQFRYVDSDGVPMQIEVPSDQYEKAVELMATKIEEGAVPGVTDAAEAKTIVRKGSLSYNQAKNLAKAGTVESLAYDAANGIVSAGCAFGISALINYSLYRLNGVDRTEAIKKSSMEGLKSGAVVFGVNVVAAQLTKTGMMKLFVPTSEALIKAFGDDFAGVMIKAFAPGGVAVGENTVAYAAKLMRAQALTAGVTIIILSADDIYKLFQGRITVDQLIKNISVTTAGVVGGYVGWTVGVAIGSAIVPGVGTTIGGVAGSSIGGSLAGVGAEKALSLIIKDDAETMMAFVEDDFEQMSTDYMVTEDEADAITTKLEKKLAGENLKELFEQEDKEDYLRKEMRELFEEQVAKREKIEAPTDVEVRSSLVASLENVVFVH